MYSKYLKILYFCTEVQWESKNSRRGLSLRYMPSSMCDLKRQKNIYNSLFFLSSTLLFCIFFSNLQLQKYSFLKKLHCKAFKRSYRDVNLLLVNVITPSIQLKKSSVIMTHQSVLEQSVVRSTYLAPLLIVKFNYGQCQVYYIYY